MLSRRPWRVVAVVAVIAAGAAAAVLQSPSGRRQIAKSVTRQPTPFTELYFTDHNKIPKVLSVSKPNTVGFTIANHEGKTVDYVYVVTARPKPRQLSVPFRSQKIRKTREINADCAYSCSAIRSPRATCRP